MAKEEEEKSTRQICWNNQPSKDNEGYVTWWVLFVNEHRIVESQEMALYRALKPIINQTTITEGSVKGEHDLNYKAVRFDSASGEFPSWIYRPRKGKIKRDTNLYDRQKQDRLANQLDKEFDQSS